LFVVCFILPALARNRPSPSHQQQPQQYQFVKPSFDEHVAPSRRHADVIIPWQRGDNSVAVDLIAAHIRGRVAAACLCRGFMPRLFCLLYGALFVHV
jgi:hypothetical protein